MKITQLRTYRLAPRWMFLKIETDAGIVGWGEPVIEGKARTVEAAVHEFAPYRQIFAGIASLPGAVFLVDGARPARDAAQVKAGGELAIGPRSAIFANFDGEFARTNQLYGGKGGIKVAF